MIETDIRELNEKIQRESQFLDLINLEMNKVIVETDDGTPADRSAG